MKKYRMSTLMLIMLVFLFTYGCAGKKRIIRHPNPTNPIRSIAILPMVNLSDDVEGPERVRVEFHKRLAMYHYEVKSIEETNLILNQQMGITLGKQLDMVDAQKLGETLGVDGVFYGFLLNFDEITTGIVNTYKVRMGWKLVNTKTGKIAWGKGISVKRAQSVGGVAGLMSSKAEGVKSLPGSSDPMGEMPGLYLWIMMKNRSTSLVGGLVSGIGGKLVDGMTGNRLKSEMDFAFNHLFPEMLVGPVSNVAVVK